MRLFKDVPMEIWAIGLVTLLINLSGVIIFFLSPFYLRSLGVGYNDLGVIEGVIEATSWIMRFISGFLTDFFHQRKPALLIAYSISAIARPVLIFLPGATTLMFSRMLDRIGNGIQASPREALIGDIAPLELKGACFGLRQSLSVIGSFVGAIFVWWIMRSTDGDYQSAFTLAAIPPVVAIFVLLFFVHEKPRLKEKYTPTLILILRELKHDLILLKKEYWILIGFACLLMMSNFSGMFLAFKATNVGLSEADAALVMIIQNMMTAISAYPVGRWADTVDRRVPLAIGIVLVIFSNIILAISTTSIGVLFGVAIWGFQMGILSSLIAVKITDRTNINVRGTAFGLYYILVGISLFLTNSLSGWIAENISLNAVFWSSAFYAFLSLLFVPFLENKELR